MLGAASGLAAQPGVLHAAEARHGRARTSSSRRSAATCSAIDGVFGTHDVPGDYTTRAAPRLDPLRARSATRSSCTVENHDRRAHHPFHLHGFSMQPISLTKSRRAELHLAVPRVPRQRRHPGRLHADVPDQARRPRARRTARPRAARSAAGSSTATSSSTRRTGCSASSSSSRANGNERPDVNANNVQVEVNQGETATMHGTYADPDGDAVTLTASTGTVTRRRRRPLDVDRRDRRRRPEPVRLHHGDRRRRAEEPDPSLPQVHEHAADAPPAGAQRRRTSTTR